MTKVSQPCFRAICILLTYFFCTNSTLAQTSISGRYLHSACFDSNKKLMLVFGGSKHSKDSSPEPNIDNRLWGWNGHNWAVLQNEGPSWREDAKMVFSKRSKKVYLYGGRIKDMAIDEFWEWNGAVWKKNVTAISPGKRIHTNISYDEARDRIVLFGGLAIDSANNITVSNDVWEWDGYNWIQLKTRTGPSPRFAFNMVYSPTLKRSIIIGGLSQKGEVLSDMWAWNGQDFELFSNNVPLLETGQGNAVCFDNKQESGILLFGRKVPGENSLANEAEAATWIWDQKEWKQLSTVSPTPRENHTLVYDSFNNQVILFGGNGREDSNFRSFSDIWIFKKDKWVAKQ